MNKGNSICRLEKLTQLYLKNHRKNVLNEIVDIVFSGEAKDQCLDFLIRIGFARSMISRLAFDGRKETVNYYKLLLALVMHAYYGPNHNGSLFDELFGIWMESDNKFKFISKLAEFAVDEFINDTDFKINILQVFSNFIVHDMYNMFIDEYYDFEILTSLYNPTVAFDDEELARMFLRPFGLRDEKANLWMLRLITSFGGASQTSVTDWQVAVAKFFQTWVSSRRHAKSVMMLLEATKATSYFAVKATKGAAGAVTFLKFAMDDFSDFEDLKIALQKKFDGHINLMNQLAMIKSLHDCTRDSFEKLLLDNLSLNDAKQLLDMFILREKQMNFATLKYFTNDVDMKRFYIDIVLTPFFSYIPFRDVIWKNFTETELEDLPRYIKFASNYNFISTFFSDVQNEMLDETKREILEHLKLIAKRVTVTGPNSFSGNSKYFWKIKTIQNIKAKEYQIDLDKTNSNDFKYALAATLCQPSKTSETKKIGIDKLRIGRVEKSNNNSYTFKCENLDDLGYTHLIFLPNTDSLKGSDVWNYLKRLRFSMFPEIAFKIMSSPIDNDIDGTNDTDLVQLMSVSKHADIHKILPDLYSPRTIVVVPTKEYLGQYSDLPLIRYGDAKSVDKFVEHVNAFFENIQRCAGIEQIKQLKEFISLEQLDQVMNQFLQAWTTAAKDKAQNGVDFPIDFQKITSEPISEPEDFKKVTTKIVSTFSSVAVCWAVSKAPLVENTWEFIYDNLSIMITMDDLIPLIENLEKVKSFVFVNCHPSVFMMTYLFVDWVEENPGSMKIIGGKLQDYFLYKHSKSIDKPDWRSEIETKPKFNPGFMNKLEVISVKDQVEEAEYCVLLYYYMKKLGYPTELIGIWTSCQRQLDLIKEVAESLLPSSIDRPNVLFNKSGVNDYIHYKYSIISLFTDSEYKELTLTGELGNYYVSANASTDRACFFKMPIPAENQLHVITGETYSCKERNNHEQVIVKDLQQLKELVNSLD